MVKSHTHGFSGTTKNVSGSGEEWTHSHTYNRLPDGNVWLSRHSFNGGWPSEGNPQKYNEQTSSVNLQHTHPFEGTTNSNASSATENRPMNYTIRVWKRTA